MLTRVRQIKVIHLDFVLCCTCSHTEYTCRYQKFKGALEKLDHKLAGNSSLPIVYMWENQMAGPVIK